MRNKKGMVFALFFIIFLTSFFHTANSCFVNTIEQKIIYVDIKNTEGPWDGTINHPFNRISTALNNSEDGLTIFVYNGTYYENIVVNKKIKLVGQNKLTTTIDGRQKKDTIHIKSEKVTITDFTITNSSRKEWYHAGIRINSSNIEIKNNIIKDNMLGVFGKKVTNIIIYENSLINDSLTFSLYDKETEPVSFSEKYFNHFVQFNTVNDKPLIYVKNQNDINIPENAGQVIALSCNGLKIKNMDLDYTDYGCMLINCSNCIIKNTSISNCDGMLWLIHSSNNNIEKNNISNNYEGICIDRDSNYNTIQKNLISKNEVFGIIIEEYSHYNQIFNNDFIENNLNHTSGQVYFKESHGNKWRGNLWNKGKIFPKMITGRRDFLKFNIPWINFDFRPALKPNT